MILDLSLLFGDKSKIMTNDRVPEEPQTHERGFLAASLAEGGGIVGVAGFEPTAPRSQSECATKLRHTPGANGVSLRAVSNSIRSRPDLNVLQAPAHQRTVLVRSRDRYCHGRTAGVAQWQSLSLPN